jgi:glycosyltransferase involved in cell wall biosynthesis
MKVVLFAHPTFLRSQSMPRFAKMLHDGYQARGHQVQVWAPQARVYHWVPDGRLSKWAGYVDQYLLFPLWVLRKSRQQPKDTLYAFTDQALGPWVPLVKYKPHVVHVHDLLALRSALGNVPENRTGITGRIYQRYIRHGFRQAKHFISISKHTQAELQRFGEPQAITSAVVYNGLNYPYAPMSDSQARSCLDQAGLPAAAHGMLLHVSGNAWYKNVAGVIRLYAHYARNQAHPLPLWLIGDMGKGNLQQALAEVPSQGQVLFFKGLSNQALQACYSQARVFLLPSLAEGFGWPLIEAQACGCPVITTDAAPMTEVAGPGARYLPRLKTGDDVQAWAAHGAAVLNALLALPSEEALQLREQCAAWPARFDADKAIEGYLDVYREVLAHYGITVPIKIALESKSCVE